MSSAPTRGLFLCFEGGDGVGKTTQMRLLSQRLTQEGWSVEATREPGGTELGQHIRELLLHGGEVAPRAEALLYAADRAHHVDTLIRPALEAGRIVVTDRYIDSSVAYQGGARGLGDAEIRDLSLWATDSLLPDLTILLDAPPQVGRERSAQRGEADRMERDTAGAASLMRERFAAMAAAAPERYCIIDATGTIEQIAAEIWGQVSPLLSVRGCNTPPASTGARP